MTRRTFFAITAPALLAGASILASASFGTARQPGARVTDEIPQPEEWTPFSADLWVQHAAGYSTYGRTYRARDGSHRLDTWGEGDDAPRVISIMNIALATHFAMVPAGWTSAPMDIQPGSYPPVRRRHSERGLVEYRYRLAIREGEDGALDAPEGFGAYQSVDQNGHLALLVPVLNFFPVFKVAIATGQRQMYYNIRVGDQAPELFLPPSEATVTSKPGPRGIIGGWRR